MASIGKMSIQVEADMSRLLTGLQRMLTSIQGVQQQANKAESALKGMAAAFSLFKAGSFLSNSVFDAFTFVQQARALGLSTEQMGALKVAGAEVGAEFADVVRWITRIDIGLGQATLSGDKAQKKFSGFLGLPSREAAAFTRLGLDVKKLIDLPADKRIREVARAVTDLASEEDRLAAAEGLLGRGAYGKGGQFLDFLKKVRFEQDEITRRGIMFRLSEDQIESIRRGRAALGDLNSTWEAAKVQLGARLAPVFDKTLTRLIDWIDESGGLDKLFDHAAEKLKDMVGSAEDIADYLRIAALSLGATTSTVAAGWARIIYQIGGRGNPGGPVANWAAEVDRRNTAQLEDAEKRFAAIRERRRMRQEAEALGPILARNHANIGSVFDWRTFVNQANFNRFVRTTGNVSRRALLSPPVTPAGEESTAFGRLLRRSLGSIRWGNLAEHARLFADEIGRVHGRLRESDDLRKWAEQAHLLGVELMTPMERFQDMAEQLDVLREKGGLSDQLANLKLFRTFSELERASGENQVNLAPAAVAGSNQAASIISHFQVRPSGDPQERLAVFAERQTAYQARLTQLVEKFAEAFNKMKVR